MVPSHGLGLAGLLAAKIVCCAVIILAATGAISFAGLAGWLVGGGLFWLAATVLAIIGFVFWHRSARPNGSDVRKDAVMRPLHRLQK